jgi:hypothetical protein
VSRCSFPRASLVQESSSVTPSDHLPRQSVRVSPTFGFGPDPARRCVGAAPPVARQRRRLELAQQRVVRTGPFATRRFDRCSRHAGVTGLPTPGSALARSPRRERGGALLESSEPGTVAIGLDPSGRDEAVTRRCALGSRCSRARSRASWRGFRATRPACPSPLSRRHAGWTLRCAGVPGPRLGW